MKDVKKSDLNRDPMISSPTFLPLGHDCSCQIDGNLWYLCTTLLTLLMYTAASPDPDPNARGGGQLPNPKNAILR